MPHKAEGKASHSSTPKPIPGGLQTRHGSLIHVLAPGPRGMRMPYTGLVLGGHNVEPSTMTDINGLSARAYIIGKATGSDGREYDLEVDVGPFTGSYIAADGAQREGTFVFL